MFSSVFQDILRNIPEVDDQLPRTCGNTIDIGVKDPELNKFHIRLFEIRAAQGAHDPRPLLFRRQGAEIGIGVIWAPLVGVIHEVQRILHRGLTLGDINLWKNLIYEYPAGGIGGNVVVRNGGRPLVGIEDRVNGIPGHFCPFVTGLNICFPVYLELLRCTRQGPSEGRTDVDKGLGPFKIIYVSGSFPPEICILRGVGPQKGHFATNRQIGGYICVNIG